MSLSMSVGLSTFLVSRPSAGRGPEDANLESFNSIHAVAAAVGGFFRELPEPLLTYDMYLEFIRAMGQP